MRKKRPKLHGISSGVFFDDFSDLHFGKKLGDYSDRIGRIEWTRFLFFYFIAVFILLIFLGRLFNLTVIAGEKNKELSESNRIRIVEVEAERGKVLDRRGKILAVSEQKYFLKKNKDEVEISELQAKDLAGEGLASQDFEGDLGKIYPRIHREYPLNDAASHVLGYTSIVTKEDLSGNERLSFSESVGRLGVEASYDNFLRGKPGKKLIEVDVLGRNISILGSVDPVPGRNVYLTIDSDLQRVAYEALKKQAVKSGSKKGAVVVQNPRTGEVLALASVPGFSGENVGRYLDDLDQPFFDRAIGGTYPPGSIFKLVSALAGLESGKITKDTEIEDVGAFTLGGARFSNWYFNQYGRREGVLKIERAIARSNDTFFYKLGEKVGLSTLRDMAIKFGFGQKTGIDLPDEGYGLVPDEVWKKSSYGDNWYQGDTMHFSIGQGFMLSTPIQLNSMISYIAINKRTRPFLVSKVEGVNGVGEIKIDGEVLGEDLVKRENLSLVRNGMKQACDEGGTGWPFFNAPYEVACKTGTAERFVGNPHAWFSVYAPFDDPQIVMTVLIEEGGEGSSVAGPVAREILDWWFKNKNYEL